jgi:RNA polymerase subunit RPABC4/transcription elongation factor Spt4
MPLRFCPRCKSPISDRVARCAVCGLDVMSRDASESAAVELDAELDALFADDPNGQERIAKLSDVSKRRSALSGPTNPNLVRCRDCNKLVSKNADSCPACGFTVRRREGGLVFWWIDVDVE